MGTFVLVHGGWDGGWCWQKVIPFLEAAGHEVYAPTLTGLAERASELSPDIGLDTHIQDVVGLLQEKHLHGVILVGHSYGGVCRSVLRGRRSEGSALPTSICLSLTHGWVIRFTTFP